MDNNVSRSSVEKINALAVEDGPVEAFDELTTIFRHLRNVCAKGSSVQNEIVLDKNILASTHKILFRIISCGTRSDEANLCLQTGLQFIGNLLVGNYEIQMRVWECYQDLLPCCLRLNTKIQNCAAMILYNIFLSHPDYMPQFEDSFAEIICQTLNENSSEFYLYLLQLYISNAPLVQKIYDSLDSDAAEIIIEVIQDLVKDNDPTLDKELISFFVNKFLRCSNNILNIAETSECSFEVIEAVKILNLLASLSSSNENNLKELQKKTSFLEHCVALLKSIHEISLSPNNNFCKIQKISDLNEIEKNTNIQKHPSFGFKSCLIRLIGNLTWKNLENQNKIRELDCIPIFLDCCKIDGRNPFITQWAVLAVRNICENNVENQKYIAALPRKGKIDTEQLAKMGILLNKNEDGSSVSICPLKLEK